MNFTVPLALYGFPVIGILLFLVGKPRIARIVGFVAAWCLLPEYSYSFTGFIDYGKIESTCFTVLFGCLIFDYKRILQLKPSLLDLPIFVWCLLPYGTSVSNGLGIYDGFSVSLNHTIQWGVPYFIGRIYFTDPKSVRELAIGLFIGGLAHIPFCLYEIRMSPQLHDTLYGFRPVGFSTTKRWGGWRPTVFMRNGLALGIWMATTAVIGFILVYSKSVMPAHKGRRRFLLGSLIVVTVLCKSTGAIMLMFIGIAVIICARIFKTKIPAYTLLILGILYMVLRASSMWSGEPLLSFIRNQISAERAASLEFRMVNEDILANKAWQRPFLGWGGHSRSRVYDDLGRDISVTDGFWIIVFGKFGFLGLTAGSLLFILPAAVVLHRLPVSHWLNRTWAATIGLCLMLIMQFIDNLMNFMYNPIWMVVSGALVGTATCLGRGARIGTPRPSKRARVRA